MNQGHISVGDNGFILLSAPNVRNEGTIRSQGGEVNLIAAQQVLALQTRDGLRLNLAGSALGEGFHGIVNNTGTLTASRLMDGPGGSIRLLASQVDVAGLLQANGVNGGGNIIVGGLFQGKGSEALNAQATTVHYGATLQANALTTGDGGQVIVWADGHSQVDGHFEAQGGSLSGNGGLIETSGKINLAVGEHTTVNTQANNGDTGLWLLDPENITIANSGGDITPSTIITALGSSDVVIHTNNGALSEAGDITVNSSLNYTSHNDLSLLAARDVRVNRSIQNSGNGDLNLVAGWDETTGFSPAGSAGLESGPFDINAILNNSTSYGNNGGSVILDANVQNTWLTVGSRDGNTQLAGHNLVLQGGSTSYDWVRVGFEVEANPAFGATGNITGKFKGDISLTASTATGGSFSHAQIGHGGNFATSGGEGGVLSGNITLDANNVSLYSHDVSRAYAQIGHGGYFAQGGAKSGDITVNALGNVSLRSGAISRSYSLIGHGGRNAKVNHGNITVNSGGHTTLTSQVNDNTESLIGHMSNNDTTGNIQLKTAGELSIINNGEEAQVGHRFTGSGTMAGNVLIQAGSLDFANDTVDLNSFVIDNTAFVTSLQANTALGDVTLASTGAPIIWDNALSATYSNKTFSLISSGDITINQTLNLLAGDGAVNLITGWDGVNGIDADKSVNLSNLGFKTPGIGTLTLDASVINNTWSGRSITAIANGEFINNDSIGLQTGNSFYGHSAFYYLYARSRTGSRLGSLSPVTTSFGNALSTPPGTLGSNNTVIYRVDSLTPTLTQAQRSSNNPANLLPPSLNPNARLFNQKVPNKILQPAVDLKRPLKPKVQLTKVNGTPKLVISNRKSSLGPNVSLANNNTTQRD